MLRKLFGLDGMCLPVEGPELFNFFKKCFLERDIEKLQKIVMEVCDGDVNKFLFRKNWTLKSSNREDEKQAQLLFAKIETGLIKKQFATQTFESACYQYDSLLQLAIQSSWPQGVDYLIRYGANLNEYSYAISKAASSNNNINNNNFVMHGVTTPLITALNFKKRCPKEFEEVQTDNLAIINHLISKTTNINLQLTNTNSTALHAAVIARHSDAIIEKLIRKGANTKAVDMGGCLPGDYRFFISKNEGLVATLMLRRSEILSRFANDPLTQQKTDILNLFIKYINDHLIKTPSEIIEDFAHDYMSNNNGEDPFEKLQEQREKRIFLRLFNPSYTTTIKALQTYLGDDKDLLIPHFTASKSLIIK